MSKRKASKTKNFAQKNMILIKNESIMGEKSVYLTTFILHFIKYNSIQEILSTKL
jgi:hypothetical protein